LACQLACRHATPEDIVILESINQEIADAIPEGNAEQIANLDVKFHNEICRMSNNSRLVTALRGLKEHVFRYRLEYISDLKNKNIIIEEHSKIIEDLKTGNEKAIKKDIDRHVETQEKFILSSL
ncbi:MAG: FCD domain-containing protein, partial [Parasporobacterium sp.]|nr:FCD domain-containing protein [Parasporobacterium sp.]